MTDLFIRLHLFLARCRGAVFALTGLFVISSIWFARQLKLDQDFTAMLPLSNPAIAEQIEALKHIRQADRMFIDVQTSEQAPEQLAQAADAMATALRGLTNLSDVRGEVGGADLQDVFQQLHAELPEMLDPDDLHALEERLQPAALEKRLAWLKKAMSQPQGLMFKDVAATDPVGVGDALSERLRALQVGTGDSQIVAGWITSADGCHALITALPQFPPSNLDRSAGLIADVLKAARAVEGQFQPGVVRVAITGAHRVALDNATLIREDTKRTSVIAVLAIGGLMTFAFRRRWLALVGLLPPVLGAMGALVVFYLVGDPVSAVALGFGGMLLGVADDYGICVLYNCDDGRPADRHELASAMVQLTPSLVFGALTTLAAFLLMLFSPIAGHRQLGLFTGVSVALAACFAIFVLPLLVPIGRQRTTTELPLTRVMDRLFLWRERHARLVLPLLGVCSCLALVGMLRLSFDGDLARLNGVTPETRRDEETLRQAWSKALSLTTVVVSGASRDEALRKNERVQTVLRRLREERAIEGFSSIAPLTPSLPTREANRRAWETFWSESRRLDLSNSLAEAATNLGFRTTAFDPFLSRLRVPDSSASGTNQSASAMDRLLQDYWMENDGRVSISTMIKAADREAFRRAREAILQEVPDARLLNKSVLGDEMAQIARRTLPVFALLVAGSNALLLLLLLGRLELVLITLLPMATGVFWTLGTLGLAGMPIDLSNFIFVVFVVGVGGDYSLFLVMAELNVLRGSARPTASTGGATTVCALTTLFGVGVLALARHPALFSVGVTALLGISLSLVATLLLVPMCMARVRRKALLPVVPDGTGSLKPSSEALVPKSRLRSSRGNEAQTERESESPHVGCYDLEIGSRPLEFKLDATILRRQVRRLYRYQEIYVTQFVFWKTKTDPLFEAVDAAVPKQGTILDLGCGYGIVAHWLTFSSPTRKVIGVDADAVKIRAAQSTASNNPRVVFHSGDVVNWEYPACDCVLLCDVLHYFPRELKAEILHKASQCLRPGGLLVIRDGFREESPRHRAVAWGERWAVWTGQNKTAHGLHFQTTEEHFALLRDAGFSEPEVRKEAGLGSNALLVAREA